MTISKLALADEDCFGGDICVKRPKPLPDHRPCTDCSGSDQDNGTVGPGGGSGNQGNENSGDDSSNTSSTPAKTQRQICLEESAVKHAICRANHTAVYTTTLQISCLGLGTVAAGGDAVFVNGGVSIDDYNQCKDLAVSKRDNGLEICNVFKAQRIRSCP